MKHYGTETPTQGTNVLNSKDQRPGWTSAHPGNDESQPAGRPLTRLHNASADSCLASSGGYSHIGAVACECGLVSRICPDPGVGVGDELIGCQGAAYSMSLRLVHTFSDEDAAALRAASADKS